MRIKLSETQQAFCFDEHRYSLFLGGVGAGKSHAGAVKAMLQVFPAPPVLGMVVAPTYPMLRDATWRTAYDVWGPLIKTAVRNEMRMELVNGHEIIFRSADDPDRLRAINAAWLWFDEAAMCHPDTWPIAIGRLRQGGRAGRAWVLHRGLLRISVDTAGIGHYFSAHLRDSLPDLVQVVDVNVGESASSDAAKERYANLKAELYWHLRERFQDGDIRGLTDVPTISQLASIRYGHPKGKVMIEPKEKARERGVKSPDRAEALMLAFAPENQSQLLARAVASTAHTREPAGVAVDSFILATRGNKRAAARPWGKR
jgi:hypothetical protein